MDQQIRDNNKLIAEFMGLTQYRGKWQRDTLATVTTLAKNDKGLKYNTDWNWLIPVVDKINRIVDKNNYGYGIGIRYNQIKPAHKTVVKFIEWYNKKGK